MGLRDAFRLPTATDDETGVMHGRRQAQAHVTYVRWRISLTIGGHGFVPYAWHGDEETSDQVEDAVERWLTENTWLTIELREAGRVGNLRFKTEYVSDFIVWFN